MPYCEGVRLSQAQARFSVALRPSGTLGTFEGSMINSWLLRMTVMRPLAALVAFAALVSLRALGPLGFSARTSVTRARPRVNLAWHVDHVHLGYPRDRGPSRVLGFLKLLGHPTSK
jgi:hypothetical protein